MPSPDPSPLALALGRIPSGLYVVSAAAEPAPLGLICSLLCQTGFDPPTLCLALGRERDHLKAIRSAGRFAVSILGGDNRDLMGAFFRSYPPGQTAFDGLETFLSPGGAPLLSASLAWLECRLVGDHELPDHVAVFGVVEHGALLREGEPAVHTRRSGLDY